MKKILNLFGGCGAGASGFFWLKERENGIVSYFMRGVVLTRGDINYNLKTKCSMQIRTGPYGNRKGFEADF